MRALGVVFVLASVAACAGVLSIEDIDYAPAAQGDAGAERDGSETGPPHDAGEGGSIDAASCDAGTSPCGPICVDFATDDRNCGSCGHACGGQGSCAGGKCQPITLASGFPDLQGIVVDDTYVYFATYIEPGRDAGDLKGSVVRVKKTGGEPPTVLVHDEELPSLLALQGGYLYWTNWGLNANNVNTVRRIPAQNPGVPETVGVGAAGGDGFFGIAVDDTFVYVSGYFSALVRAFPLSPADAGASFDGGIVVATVSPGATTLVRDGRSLYVTGAKPSKDVRRVDLDVPDSSVVISGGFSVPWGLAVDTNYVYVGDQFAGIVYRIPKAGGPAEPIAKNIDGPSGIAVDGTHVYFCERGNGGSPGHINRILPDGGAFESLAGSQSEPITIALDKDYVYWANNVDGTVRKVAK